MTPDRPRRYLFVFFILVMIATWFDIYSKNVVFEDLGYLASPQKMVEGTHEVFTTPGNVEGQTVLYLDNWIVFQLYTNFNFGALWGLGQGFSLIFGVFGCLAIVGILIWVIRFNGASNLWLTISLALILAGTFGNLYDRLGFHGYVDEGGNTILAVRDFLFFRFGGREGYFWPIFNFADTFLVTGAIMMFLHSLFLSAPQKTNNPESIPQSTTEAPTTSA